MGMASWTPDSFARAHTVLPLHRKRNTPPLTEDEIPTLHTHMRECSLLSLSEDLPKRKPRKGVGFVSGVCFRRQKRIPLLSLPALRFPFIDFPPLTPIHETQKSAPASSPQNTHGRSVSRLIQPRVLVALARRPSSFVIVQSVILRSHPYRSDAATTYPDSAQQQQSDSERRRCCSRRTAGNVRRSSKRMQSHDEISRPRSLVHIHDVSSAVFLSGINN